MKPDQSLLLVEDDRVDAMTVRRSLRELEAPNPLHHVTDGEAALAFLRDPANERPGLILLDINMPRMNGIEFLAHMKGDAALSSIPVVVLTTSKDETDRFNTFSKNVAGYMVKPVDYDQFVEVMRKIRDYWMLSETAH
jgi:CheY-like chemotaxis protein